MGIKNAPGRAETLPGVLRVLLAASGALRAAVEVGMGLLAVPWGGGWLCPDVVEAL